MVWTETVIGGHGVLPLPIGERVGVRGSVTLYGL